VARRDTRIYSGIGLAGFKLLVVLSEKSEGKSQAAHRRLAGGGFHQRGRRGGCYRNKNNIEESIMKQQNYDDSGTTLTMNPPKGGRGSGKPDADREEMMKKAEAAGRPGPGHKALEHFIGNWKAEVKCWMEPGGEPHVSQATAVGSWIMNGRFLEEDFHGEMMGKPFHGRTLLGFDNFKRTFNSVWISDMQTSMFTTEGKGENDNRLITLEGTSSCAGTGQKDIPMKVVLRILSPNMHTFEMFDGSRGEDAKTMEITYTRA
jgi:hypothetical protein